MKKMNSPIHCAINSTLTKLKLTSMMSLKKKAVHYSSDYEHTTRPSVSDVCQSIIDFNRYKPILRKEIPKRHPPALLFSGIGDNFSSKHMEMLIENLLMKKYI
jgi:hypothetical protein